MAKIMAAEGTDPAYQPQMTEQEKEQRLKYLAFVQSAALHALFLAVKLYNYAKDKSGLLKPGIQTVEGTVKTVVGPIYNKFHDVPVDFLKFVDRKVDESVNKVPFPPMLMQVAVDVKTVGVIETASGLVRMVYIKSEPVAEKYAVCAWRSLNKLPLFPLVAQTVVVPTAAFCSEKYNQTVQITAQKGYKVATYLPLVPTDKIAEVFSSDCNNKHMTDSQDKAPDAPAEVEGTPAENYTSDAY